MRPWPPTCSCRRASWNTVLTPAALTWANGNSVPWMMRARWLSVVSTRGLDTMRSMPLASAADIAEPTASGVSDATSTTGTAARATTSSRRASNAAALGVAQSAFGFGGQNAVLVLRRYEA